MFGFARRRAERAAAAAEAAEAARIPALARELHRCTRAVRDAIVRRRLSYLIGLLAPLFGIGYLSLGLVPAVRVGWDLSAQVHAGRGNGFTPLGFVLAATVIIGGLLIFMGVGTLVSSFKSLAQAENQLLRFRIENETELPVIEVLAAELAATDDALAARVRQERAEKKRAQKKRTDSGVRIARRNVRMPRTSGWAAVAAAVTLAVTLGGCSGSGADGGPAGAGSPTSTTPSSSSPSGPSTTTPPQVIIADPEFAELEAQYGARLGVFIVDTVTGTELSWRADERFAYASTHKALTAGALLDEVGIAGLQETVTIDAGVPVGHSPVTELRVGGSMTLGELAAAAVEQSDNGAANLLFERLGGPAAFGAMLLDLGDDVTNVARTELALNEAVPGDLRDTSSPRAFARDLQAYALGSAAGGVGSDTSDGTGGAASDGPLESPLDATEQQTLIGWMSNSTTGDTLIRAGTPEGWTVADKSGAGGYGTRNNIAVLWPPEGSPSTAPLVMAVMSSRDTADADYNDQLIADAAAAAIAAITASQ